MKHIFIVVMLLSLAICMTGAQTVDRSPAPAPESYRVTPPTDAQFDLQFDFDASTVTGAAGNAGAVFTGTEFWTSRWASNILHRWNPNGTLIEQFTIAGVTGVRGMTYDGQYIYASSNSASIFKIDPVTRTLVSTIACQGGVTTRMIAYDPVRDGFWTANFADAISCVSRTGAVIATISNTLVAKYGAAYDRWTPGGPYLWVWDQTNTTGGTPQPIYQFNMTTLAYTGVSFDILTRVTTGGATPIAGGLFITTGLVGGKATIGGLLQGVPDRLWGLELAATSADTVLPFTLLTPAAGTKFTTLPGSTTPVVISWDTNRVGVTYKWIFGNPTVPPRRFTLPSATSTLTTTLGALDAMLAAGGVAQGDSLIGQWDVWAFRNNLPANDSLKATNGPRAIILKRGRPSLSTFNLLNPPTGTRWTTNGFTTAPLTTQWQSAGPGVTYKWKFATPAFPGTIRFNVPTSLDTSLTYRTSQLDSLLAGMGVTPGDSLAGQWRVYAYAGTDSLASTQTFTLTMKRAAIVNLLYDDFTSGAGNWTITNDGGTCVWAINNTSARYTVPATSVLPVLAADVDQCGSGTTLLSTATLTNGINCTHASSISLEWDNDWHFLASVDIARVQASYDGGATWSTVVEWAGADRRNSHELFSLPSATGVASLKVRFVSIQPGWDWWWAIDNVQIKGEIVTGVDDHVVTKPVEFSLSQNYPNPFNPSTTIRYALPEQSTVTLRVFNILGQEVRTLVNELQNATSYKVVWDGLNARGQQVSTGIYFYQLQAKSSTGKSFTSLKKMLLIK